MYVYDLWKCLYMNVCTVVCLKLSANLIYSNRLISKIFTNDYKILDFRVWCTLWALLCVCSICWTRKPFGLLDCYIFLLFLWMWVCVCMFVCLPVWIFSTKCSYIANRNNQSHELCILYLYMRKSIVERYFRNKTDFNEIIDSCSQLNIYIENPILFRRLLSSTNRLVKLNHQFGRMYSITI